MALNTSNIFLVGLMGSGKTTIGRQLANALNRRFIDSDHEIESRTGAAIAWIFDKEGEAGFRDREAQVIDDLTRRQGIVLATGGGAILRDENRRCLKERGLVIYLHGTIEQLIARTARDQRRPLLRQGDPRTIFERLFRERESLYRETADLVFITDRRPAKVLAKDICQKLKSLQEACS